MSERLREVTEMLAGSGVDFLRVQLQRPGKRQQLVGTAPRARYGSPIMTSALTSQNEQIVKVPSSPLNPVSVPSTR